MWSTSTRSLFPSGSDLPDYFGSGSDPEAKQIKFFYKFI